MATNKSNIPNGPGKRKISSDVLNAMNVQGSNNLVKSLSEATLALNKNTKALLGKDDDKSSSSKKTPSKTNPNLPSENKPKSNFPKKDQNGKVIEEAIDKMKKNLESVFEKNNDSLKTSLLGPLNLITSPLESFFGFDLGKTLKNGIFSDKKAKKNPNANDVMKIGVVGSGFLYVTNQLTKALGVDKKKPKENSPLLKSLIGKTGLFGASGALITKVLPKFFTKAGLLTNAKGETSILKTLLLGSGKGGVNLTKLGKVLAKGGGILGIATGAIGIAKDGINATKQNWNEGGVGSGNASKAIGGILGGLGSGIQGAFSNMGKWASMGAGIGTLVFPGVGTIIGGAIGGLLGGLLGFIGGEKIAKFSGMIGNFFKDKVFPSIKNFIFEIFNVQQFIDIWKGEGSIAKKIGATLGTTIKTLVVVPFKVLAKEASLFKKIGKTVVDSVIQVFPILLDGLKAGGNGLKKLITKTIPTVFSKIKGKVISFMKNFFLDIIPNMFTIISTSFKNFFTSTIPSVISSIKDKVTKVFGDFFLGFIEGISGGFKWDTDKGFTDNMKTLIGSIFGTIGNAVTNWFDKNPIGVWIKNNLWTPVINFFSTIGDSFKLISYLWDSKGGIFAMDDILKSFKKDSSGSSQMNRFIDLQRENRLTDVEMTPEQVFKKIEKVDDAIIKPDGSLIKTNPKDTLVALKDIPSSSKQSNSDLEAKLDKVISLLTGLLNKEAVVVTNPQQTRYDLDLIINGRML